jgi:hypothetical protein
VCVARAFRVTYDRREIFKPEKIKGAVVTSGMVHIFSLRNSLLLSSLFEVALAKREAGNVTKTVNSVVNAVKYAACAGWAFGNHWGEWSTS